MKYVCGFAIYNNFVFLVLKQFGPEVVLGKWNGIGGKIEDGESSQAAMTREFLEETGLLIGDWHKFCSLRHANTFEVDFYYSFFVNPSWPLTYAWPTRNDVGEPLAWRDSLTGAVPNLKWLLPMARSIALSEESASVFVVEQRLA